MTDETLIDRAIEALRINEQEIGSVTTGERLAQLLECSVSEARTLVTAMILAEKGKGMNGSVNLANLITRGIELGVQVGIDKAERLSGR